MIENKFSICFIAPFAYPLLSKDCAGSTGGAERQFFLFGRELAKRDWRVSFITARSNDGSISSDHGFSVYHANFSYLGGSNSRMACCWISLLCAMKKAKSNYYALKVPGHLLAPMSIFCRLYRRKLVFWAQMTHDSNPDERKFNYIANCLQDWGIKRADVVISQSNDQVNGFKRNYNIESILVPSICKRLSFSNSIKVKINTVDKKSDVLWVGSSSEKKRQEVIFGLARLLPHRTFTIAMNKSDNVRFTEAAKEAKELPNVIFLGTISPIKMENWFRKTKLLINTSIREGFPNTFLQAWMNSSPVISLQIDPDETIQKFDLGKVIGEKQVNTCNENFSRMAQLLVPVVEELLVDSRKRNTIAGNAKSFVENRHYPSVVLPMLIDALAS